MKKFLTAALAAMLALSLSLPALAVPPVKPVSVIAPSPVTLVKEAIGIPAGQPVYWFVDTDDYYVNLALNMGIVNGDENGHFNPLGTLTHAEWAQMLRNAFGGDNQDFVYQFQKDGQWVEETGWWINPVHWLEDSAIYPHYEGSSEDLRLSMWETYFDFYQTRDDWYESLVKWADEPASYDWCVEMMYLLYTAANATGPIDDSFATAAHTWAVSRNAGISDSWRNTSNMGAASGQHFTRTEAVALLFRLGEIS